MIASDVMPRKSLDASDDTKRLTIRLTKQQLAQLDENRGKASRSAYLRDLIGWGLKTAELDVKLDEPTTRTAGEVIEKEIYYEPTSFGMTHRHRFVKDSTPSTYWHRGAMKIPVYRAVCECGETREAH